ncbi:helix-turn-helix transcriptional regulator [Pelomonas sp. V22]|nr:helix-turn-helix transcriptional regulator [Pelomonas sp. V22]
MPKAAHDLTGQPLRLIFAKNIRMARIDCGLSQEALADHAGLDRAFVGTLERGTRNISIDNVERLAVVVGIPAHELLNPRLAAERGYDPTLTRAPRAARPYPTARKLKPASTSKSRR